MFNLFKSDPVKKLKKEYARKFEQSIQAQRNGKIELYANLAYEAEEILKKIKKIENKSE